MAPEGRLFRHGFGAGIDQQAELPGVLTQAGNRPRASDGHAGCRSRSRRDGLGRRHICLGEIGLLKVAENLPQGRRRRGYDEASAHSGA